MRSLCLTALLAFIPVAPLLAAPDILLPSGVTIAPGQQVAFPVSLAQPAPAGGVFVTISSSDTSKVTVSPQTAFITQGQTMTIAQIKVTGVNVGNASITAAASNLASATELVRVSSESATIAFSQQTLSFTAAGTQNVLLNLSTAAPAGGLFVSLSSDNPFVARVQPSTHFFPDGSSHATIVIPITAVGTGTAVIRADAGPSMPVATLTVNVGTGGTGGGNSGGAITLTSGIKVNQGQSTTFPVTLTTPAPAGGVTVTLASSDPGKVTLSSSSIAIAAGATSPLTQPQVNGVGVGSSTISASAPGYTSASQSVQVQAVQQTSFTLSFAQSTLNLVGAGASNLQLNVSPAAPTGGIVVNLASSNTSAVTVGSNITIPAGSTSVNVPVTAVNTGTATITASSNAANVTSTSATVTVGARDIILPSGLILLPGGQARIMIVLSKPAPISGVFITLTSSDPNKLKVSPSTVIVSDGSTVALVQPLLTALDFGTVTLTASAMGFVGDSQIVRIGTPTGFTPSSATLSGIGTTQNLVLNLTSPAPAGGLTVNLSSTNTGVATVPQTVVFPANVSSMNVPVTTVGTGSTVIHASAPPTLADTTANITVVTSSSIGLPANVNAPLGQPVAFPITLGSPAGPGGVSVTLTSSDPKRVSITPGVVFIPQGSTTPAAQPLLLAVNTGTITITASAQGFATVSQTVLGTATVTFAQPSLTVKVGQFATVLLALSGSAPPGDTGAGRCSNTDQCGIVIALRSDNQSVALVQPNTGFFPDGSSQAIVQVPVIGVAPGTTTIHAGAPPYIPDTTITVIVQP